MGKHCTFKGKLVIWWKMCVWDQFTLCSMLHCCHIHILNLQFFIHVLNLTSTGGRRGQWCCEELLI